MTIVSALRPDDPQPVRPEDPEVAGVQAPVGGERRGRDHGAREEDLAVGRELDIDAGERATRGLRLPGLGRGGHGARLREPVGLRDGDAGGRRAAQQRRVGRAAAEDRAAQRLRAGEPGVEQPGELGRDERDERDAVAGDARGRGRGVERRRVDERGGAVDRAAQEDHQPGDVRHRQRAQPALRGVVAERRRRAERARLHVAERELDGARRARGPGGVHDERHVVVRAPRGGATRARVRARGHGRVHHHARARLDPRPLGRAEAQVDGHRGRAEREAAVQRLGERDARRQGDRHTIARPRAARCERRRDAVRGARELRVRPRRAGLRHGHAVGAGVRPALEPSGDPHRAETRLAAVAVIWTPAGEYGDIRYETSAEPGGIAKITIDRPEVRNAFRPQTLFELADAFDKARDDPDVGVIVLTGEGPHAFCSGGDQRIRGDDGYIGDDAVAKQGIGRLNVLDLQVQIRRTPKPVVAMVAGYAIGGGHVLHVVCDLTIAAENARFGQTGPRVGSFDGGYGSGLLARQIGQKRAREIWFLCRQYDAQQALDWGLVNAVVPLERLEEETVAWCGEMLALSPLALRMLKASFNAADDGLAGIQQLAGDATLLFYMSEEAQEGRDAYKEKRRPDFSRFPRRP